MYDYIIVTHLPAFYKVNLYNELAKKLNIFVVFVANETNEKRTSDFASLTNACFEYSVLSDHAFQNRNKFKTLWKLFSVLRNYQFKKIILSGWDLPEFWMVALLSSHDKNCLALESTVIECNIKGVKGGVKKAFLSMIGTVFASGKLHVDLLKRLNYQKNIKITKGVGIINKPSFERVNKKYQKRFLFVGRLSKVKNLELLINVFNELPRHQLTIIGDGEEKRYLASIANVNIKFIDPIENKKLKHEFNENDIFILPSISEAWGLVVEEALYFGLPVIVSENCGASELIMNDINGFIVNPRDEKNILNVIEVIDENTYDRLVENVLITNINEKDKIQIEAYQASRHF